MIVKLTMPMMATKRAHAIGRIECSNRILLKALLLGLFRAIGLN